MEFSEYIEQSGRTAARGKNLIDDLRHAIYGLTTETGEIVDIFKKLHFYGKPINRNHLREELGDLFWYIALGHRALNLTEGNPIETPSVFDKAAPSVEDIEMQIAGLLEEQVQCYDRIWDHIRLKTETFDVEGSKLSFRCILHYATKLALYMDFKLGDVLQTNIDKLKARYPNGFSTQDALNRNLEVEVEVLARSAI